MLDAMRRKCPNFYYSFWEIREVCHALEGKQLKLFRRAFKVTSNGAIQQAICHYLIEVCSDHGTVSHLIEILPGRTFSIHYCLDLEQSFIIYLSIIAS